MIITDSSETGRQVMSAGAANLVPVTLELDSRLAAFVCGNLPVATAPERIIQVKCLITGQICATVDRAFVPHWTLDAFVALTHVGATPVPVDVRRRVIPRRRGHPGAAGMTHPGVGTMPRTQRPPTDADVMTREMSGRIMPVIGSTNPEEVVTMIIAVPRPLALCPFTNDQSVAQRIINRVMSGGVTVNDALLQVAQNDLPLGGVGASGMGQYRGRVGFTTFSKMRPVPYQGPTDAMRSFHPCAERLRRATSIS